MSDQRKSPFATVNPYTGETLAEFDAIEGDAVDDAVETAGRAFEAWRARPIAERAAVVARAAGLMRERKEELARTITLEMGKLIAEARGEVDLAASILDYYAEHGPEFAAAEPLDVEEGEAYLVSEPLGVLLGVMPWNFPLYQVVRFAGPNLVLGNTVLVKHAGICPQSALALESLFRDAEAPEGVYTNLFVSHDEIARVIDSPVVRGASLTGSEKAGAEVAERAGRNMKPSLLELGGSDVFVVLDREGLERTIGAAVAGRMANTGQSCVASKRFIVLDEIHDDFVDGLRRAFEELRPGDPADEATTLGPLSSERAAADLADQIRETVEQGAELVTGGHRIDRPGAFVEPTVLTGVKPGMRAYAEELFGPAAVVYRVADEDEAVALANDSRYGLGGSVFCADVERGRRVAERIETGMVWVNHPTSTQPDLPFGGIKRSGYGRELSKLGTQEFVNRKLVRILPPDARLRGIAG
ncbi:succinate-semialdehyde dehydrogenase [NADP(+)] [Streptomyces subrutilus]|uniref:NAD-dependent succinate-semialdehyde dehydrogenase n=1 Tax=Streptomyces subrutilus TaxID=36818 RepID=A0A5P2UFM8_9ACTN|nr:NAD-dependent succinate-semialdehyde dehydrogenase [Streptomyces subrutilus]QEU78046.1 NAD-dependent succinate-semialdehyde dehydrogenase [Streptomyces subrutilus]GGZ56571.1 succinate-semialdehyde dehydrogenase [NADP(+)] [Streptomyces subrutilus]